MFSVLKRIGARFHSLPKQQRTIILFLMFITTATVAQQQRSYLKAQGIDGDACDPNAACACANGYDCFQNSSGAYECAPGEDASCWVACNKSSADYCTALSNNPGEWYTQMECHVMIRDQCLNSDGEYSSEGSNPVCESFSSANSSLRAAVCDEWCVSPGEYQCGDRSQDFAVCCINPPAEGCYSTDNVVDPTTGVVDTQWRCGDCNGCYDKCRDNVYGGADLEAVRRCMDGCRAEYGDSACEPSVCPGEATMCGDNLTCCISGNCIKGDRLEGCDANDDYCFEYTCAEGTSGDPGGGNGTGDIGDVGGIAETGDITGGETGGTGASGGNGGSTKSQTMSGNTSSPKPPSSSSKKSSSTSATTWSASSTTSSANSSSKTSSSKTSASTSRSSSSLSTQTTSASTSAQSSEACENMEYKLEMCEIMGASSVSGSENDPNAICEVCSPCALQEWNNQLMKFCQWQTCEGWGGKFIACGGSSSSTSRSISSSSRSSSSSSSYSSSSYSSSSLIAGIGGTVGGTNGTTGATTGGTTGNTTGGNTGGTVSSSSRSSSSTSSVLTLVGGACFGTECEYGGDFFCELQGKTCFQTAAFPCLECIRTTSRSSSSARSFSLASLSFSEDSTIWTSAASTPSLALDPIDPSLITASECSLDAPCGTNEFCVANECLSEEEVFLLPPFCGNARRDRGEQCDEGSLNSDKPNALCRPDCTIGRCGDTIRDTPLELCDDGNTTNNDGCSSLCQIERSAPTPTETLPATVIELPLTTIIAGVPSDQQNIPSPPRTSDTGPAALALMIAGASAGYAFMKRKRK